MNDKVKNLLSNILTSIVLIVIVFTCWLIIVWLYPDEWFAEIPKLILGLLKP